MDEYFVLYAVPGFGPRQAGPYATVEEAQEHALDIAGYEGVTDVRIDPDPNAWLEE